MPIESSYTDFWLFAKARRLHSTPMSDVTRLLDALRGRADFQKLFTEVEVTAEKAKP